MEVVMGNPNGTTHGTLAAYADHVKVVAARVAHFHTEIRGVLKISSTEDPNYYHAYPFLFRDEFPGVEDEATQNLAVAGVFYLNHLCQIDDVVDSGGSPQTYKLFLSTLLHEEALVLLATLFPAGSPFWIELSSYHREFVAAMLQEQTQHNHRLVPFTEAEIFQVAKGKAALSKITTTALALLANRPETIAALSASQDHFNAARQLYDDVKDWKEDYLNQRYSSLLTAALLEAQTDVPANLLGDVEGLSARLHYGGHIERALTQAAQWCEEASRQVADYKTEGWKRLIESLRAQVLRLRDDLAVIRERASAARTALPIQEETKPV